MRRRALAPFLLSALTLALTLGLGLWAGLDWFWELASGWLPGGLDWLAWLLVPAAALLALVAAACLWVPLAHLLAAPFHEALAAAVARALGHRPPETGWREGLRGLGRGLRLLGLWLAAAAGLLLLAAIPGLGALVPLGWVLLGAWLMAREHLDYPLAWHPEDRGALRQRPGLRLGFGLAALALASFPVLNLLAVPAAVAGAVELWHRAAAPPAGPPRDAR